MRILYARTSTFSQSTDRQRVFEKNYDLVVEDKCSGIVPFFEREGGRRISDLLSKGVVSSISVWEIDRLGRSLHDILNVVSKFTSLQIPIEFINQGLRTIDENGSENPISKMIISILGVVGEMERTMIKERQREGIELAKLKKNVYLGRKIGSSEDVLDFLSKSKNKTALGYLKKGYKNSEVSKIVGLHPNTITKIKKLGLTTNQDRSLAESLAS
jgi:DNA invertase Pin-like site-specific DNA recombinase